MIIFQILIYYYHTGNKKYSNACKEDFMPDGPVPLPITIFILIVLVLISGFFSATETAFSTANKLRLRTLSQNGNKRAQKVLLYTEEKFDKLIGTVLIGNNIVNLTAATLSTLLFARIITNKNIDSSFISTVVITVAVLIFGEITPKFIAKTYPEKFAMIFYPLVMFFYYLLFIFNFIFDGWRWLISKIFKVKKDDKVTEEEIMTIVEEAKEDGTLKEEETKLIRSVIEFDDVEVGDILVPRVNISAVEVTSSLEEIKEVFEKEGYSRLPVYKDSIDTIIGTIHEKDFFNAYLSKKNNIDEILQNAFYTTEHVKISILLRQLQKKKTHIAVVLDEFGGTLGIVTLEDILEELVGEILDEHDDDITYIKQQGDKTFVVEGNTPLSDFFEYFSLKGDEDNFDSNSLSGFIIEYLQEIPRANKSFCYKNLDIVILKSTVKRVLSIKVTVKEKEE